MFLFSVYFSAFLLVFGLLSIAAALYYFLSVILELSDFISLFSCDCLSVCVSVGFAEVYSFLEVVVGPLGPAVGRVGLLSLL